MLTRSCVFLAVIFASLFAQAQDSPKPETQSKIREYEASPKTVNEPVDGELPLFKAVKANDYELAKWLLEHGADVNGESEEGKTAIEQVEDLRMAELLVEFHPELDDGMGMAVLKFAASETKEDRTRWKQIVDLYVSHGVEHDVMSAAMMEDLTRIKELLAPLTGEKLMETIQEVLGMACMLRKTEVVRFLIDTYHLNVNEPIGSMEAPLFYAGIMHPDILQLMIDKGANLSITFPPDRTEKEEKPRLAPKSLDDALGQMIEIAVNEILDQMMPIDPYCTLLHCAVSEGHPGAVRLLLKAGLDPLVSPPGMEGKFLLTPIENAAFVGSFEKTEMLLSHPKFQQLPDQLRIQILNRCLARATEMAGAWLMEELEQFSDPEYVLLTKTMEFSKPNNLAVIKLLLKQGADVNSVLEGRTACQRLADLLEPRKEKSSKALREIIQYLIENGSEDKLFAAVAMEDEAAVARVLTEKKDQLNVVAGKGFTPLHLAARLGNEGIVKKLLDAGANVNGISEEDITVLGMKLKDTPLDEAIAGEHAAVIELLKAHGGKTEEEARAKEPKATIED